jgi:hypothetical protein
MIEVIIERWTQRDGTTEYLWSIWREGERAAMGEPRQSADAAESEALDSCRRSLRQEPDRITRL